MIRKLIFAVVIVVLIAMGAAGWLRFRMKQVNFTFTLHLPSSNFTRIIIEADGRQVLERPLDNTPVQVQVPGHPQRSYGSAMLPQLKAKLLYPCGWKTMDIKVAGNLDDPKIVDKMKSGAISLPADVLVPESDNGYLAISVDNRDHAATTISVGQQVREVPSNEKGTGYQFAYEPGCDEGRKVMVGGVPAGELPKEIKETPVDVEYDPRDLIYSHKFLVDTSGKRCYAYNYHCYVPKGSEGCFAFDPTIFRKRLLHHMPKDDPDFFLQELPKQVTAIVYPGQTLVLKYSLKQVSCDWDRASDL